MFETATEAPPYPDPGEVVWDDTLKQTLLTTGWQGTGFKFHETYVPLYTDRTCLIINLRKKTLYLYIENVHYVQLLKFNLIIIFTFVVFLYPYVYFYSFRSNFTCVRYIYILCTLSVDL